MFIDDTSGPRGDVSFEVLSVNSVNSRALSLFPFLSWVNCGAVVGGARY